MLPQSSYTIKIRTWPVWLIFALSGIPGAILLITEPASLAGAYILSASCVFVLLLFAFSKGYKIYIDDEELVFIAFGRKRSIRWTDIRSTSVEWEALGLEAAGPSWAFQSFDRKEIRIPLGYYSRHDIKQLARQTISKAKSANISEKVYKFAEGKFPWYFF